MPVATPADVALWLPALAGGGDDPRVAQAIATAEESIAEYLGLYPPSGTEAPTLASRSYTLYAGGVLDEVRVDGVRLRLPVWPCTAVTTIHDDPAEEYAAASLVASSDYAIVDNGKSIRLKPSSSHAWSESERAIKLVVVCGHTRLPPALLKAVGLQVQHTLSQTAGIQTTIDGAGVRISPVHREIPPEVTHILDQMRDYSAGAA